MSKTLTIARHELLVTLKRTSFILVTLAVPLLMLVGYGVYQGVQHWYRPSEPTVEVIGYVDQAGGFDEYNNQIGATFIPYPGEEEAKQALLAGETKEYFVISQDYLSSGSIIRYTRERELEPPPETMERIQDFLISNLIGEQAPPEVLDRVKTPMLVTSIILDESGNVVENQNPFVQFFLPYIFAILLMLSIFFASGYLLQGVSEEKENRLIEVLLSSVSARQLMVGKVLGLGTAGLAQMLVWVASIEVFIKVARVNIPALSDLSIPSNILVLGIVYYILGYLLFAVLSAGIGSIGSTARESQSWSGIMATTAMVPLWLSAVIIQSPDHIISKVLTIFPLTAPITAMMRLPLQSIPAWELALSLVLLVASIVFSMWAAAKVFRTALLMYGKRPSLKEIVRYIREA